MQIIKGFVTLSSYINNTPGVNSILGELSTWSTTYSKDKGEYQDINNPGYKLITFQCIDQNTGLPDIVSEQQVTQIINVIKECIAYATTHIRPYNPNDFVNHILTTFNTQIGGVYINSFVDNGSIALPSSIGWVSNTNNGNIVKIWLADAAFANEYDQYEIEVVTPIDTLDNFFGFYQAAVDQVQDITLSDLLNKVEIIKAEHPETYLRILQFDYVNPLNTSQRTETNWPIIIYGKAGDNIDVIRDSLVQYILSNSTHNHSEWTTIFPDIFKRTEFVILPRWDKIAIPNLMISSALYSSILNPVECIQFAQTAIDFYQPAYIEDNINILPFDYKALSLLVINGMDNTVDHQHFEDEFPDYIPVSTSTLDFNRMSIRTREWLLLLQQLLIHAETATEFTSLPNNLRRIKRNNAIYITAVYEGINYLVAAKSNHFYS